jgi:Protein of unknown function (DUF732)
MKNIVKAVLGGVAVAGALALGTGVAQADDFQIHGSQGDHSGFDFARELRYQALNVDSSLAVDLGWRVCNDLAAGTSERTLELYLMDHGYSANQAVNIVAGGRFHFCPQFNPRGPVAR